MARRKKVISEFQKFETAILSEIDRAEREFDIQQTHLYFFKTPTAYVAGYKPNFGSPSPTKVGFNVAFWSNAPITGQAEWYVTCDANTKKATFARSTGARSEPIVKEYEDFDTLLGDLVTLLTKEM